MKRSLSILDLMKALLGLLISSFSLLLRDLSQTERRGMFCLKWPSSTNPTPSQSSYIHKSNPSQTLKLDSSHIKCPTQEVTKAKRRGWGSEWVGESLATSIEKSETTQSESSKRTRCWTWFTDLSLSVPTETKSAVQIAKISSEHRL